MPMKPELLSQCLSAWMTDEDISVADLTGMIGYKSKTSVFRLLKGQCNEQTMASFVELITPYLDENWTKRFQKSLRVEKYGLQRYQMFESMMDCICNRQKPAAVPDSSLMPSGGKNVLILGRPWKETNFLIDRMLHDGYHIVHYVDREAIYTFSGLLQSLIQHIDCPNYEALMVEEMPSGVWNLMVTDTGELFLNGQWYHVSDGGEAFLSLRPDSGTSLYRFADLHRGDDYIKFMEKAYQLESGGAAIIAKQTPGIQMIPEDIVEKSLTDNLFDQIEPVTAALGSLRMILRKRIDNFYQRKQPVVIVFDKKAMTDFIRTGITTDHFYACRPFSPKERQRIVQVLLEFSRQEHVTMLVAERNPWHYSMEAYENRGLLIYPGYTKYNTQMEYYRELFLPGQEFFDFFSDLTNEMVLTGNSNISRMDQWLENTVEKIKAKHR